MPRDASASPLDRGGTTAGYAFPRASRLQTEAEFAGLAKAGPDSIRLAQRWFVLTAKPAARPATGSTPAAPRVRFGLTVAKRLARRSVDRVLVKRILREAARHAAPAIGDAARGDLDILLRLKAPLPARTTISRAELKHALRADADAVLARLRQRLSAVPATP